MDYWQKVEQRAQELGATITGGINWTWAEGFPTEEAAEQFLREFPGLDNRGVYHPHQNDKFPGWSVRYR